MPSWERLCLAGELAPESARIVALGTRRVLVVRSAGRFFAASPRCPHLGMSLESGEVASGTVRCRSHGYQMDLATGDCLSEKGLSLPVYPIEEREGWLWVETSSL